MLSITSQYALRALAYLAAHRDGEAVLGRTISKETGIPKNYLSKLLIELNSAGIVHAMRGTGGGYRLTADPESIKLERIVALFDRDIVGPFCLLACGRPCSDEVACSAHAAWKSTRSALVKFLHETTLADISSKRPVTAIRGKATAAAMELPGRRRRA